MNITPSLAAMMTRRYFLSLSEALPMNSQQLQYVKIAMFSWWFRHRRGSELSLLWFYHDMRASTLTIVVNCEDRIAYDESASEAYWPLKRRFYQQHASLSPRYEIILKSRNILSQMPFIFCRERAYFNCQVASQSFIEELHDYISAEMEVIDEASPHQRE